MQYLTLFRPQQEEQAASDVGFVAEVDKGVADIDAGRVLTNVEAAADMEYFFAKLARENNKAE